MINHAVTWATQRGLSRKSEVHGEFEYRVPTTSSFAFTNIKKKEVTGSGSMLVDDPNGTLLDFSGFSLDAALSKLGQAFCPHLPAAEARSSGWNLCSSCRVVSRGVQAEEPANLGAECRSVW